jgi:2-isopropylmalate synthase
VGRSYEAVIRVNSQSGKGGVAYIMKFEHGFDLPRRLQIEFSSVIQKLTEASGTEIPADQIWSAFQATYLTPTQPVGLVSHPMLTTAAETGETTLEASVRVAGGERWIKGHGNGPIAAFVSALGRDLGLSVEIVDYTEHALGEGADARAAAYVEAKIGGRTRWGVGVDANIVTASLRAVLSAVNRG